jgi:hypothetical protein
MTTLAAPPRITEASATDRVIRISTAAAVLTVAGVAAYVSYWHAYAVVRAHGESGLTARLEPATIDSLVYASSPHSGIGLHTPYSVHIGTADAIQDKRQAVLNAACTANPRRFTRRPKAPKCQPRPGSTNRSRTATLRSLRPRRQLREQQKPVSHLT